MNYYYKRNSANIIIFWGIDIDGNKIHTHSGIVGYAGKDSYSILTMKSIDVEVKSKINSKRREGYTKIDCLPYDNNYAFIDKLLPKYNLALDTQLLPMKARKFYDVEMEYPVIGQPKINGIRAVNRLEFTPASDLFTNGLNIMTFRSKEGLRYMLPKLNSILTTIINMNDDRTIAFDGELYIPGKHLNHIKASIPTQLSTGTISRPTNSPRTVQFWCFDLAIENVTNKNRDIMRFDILNSKIVTNVSIEDHLINTSSIVNVPSVNIGSKKEAEEFTDYCIRYGFEGAIFRQPNAQYAFGQRPKSMTKLKRYKDGEFVIVDIKPKDKEPETAMFILRNDINTETFECNPEGTYAERAEYLTNKHKYIGKLATVKYYERSGVKLVPFHANVVSVRNYE